MGTKNTGTNDEQQPAEEVEGQAPDDTSEEGNQPDPEQEAEENEEQTDEEQDDEDESDEDKSSDLSREDALAALTKTRKSEAKYRTRLRDLEAKFENAKTPEEVESVIEEIRTANATETRDLLVENVALKHGLPDDLTEALKAFNASTREELDAHAKVLAKYAPRNEEDPDLSGGLDPSDNPEDFDPKKTAQQMRRQRRRGR